MKRNRDSVVLPHLNVVNFSAPALSSLLLYEVRVAQVPMIRYDL